MFLRRPVIIVRIVAGRGVAGRTDLRRAARIAVGRIVCRNDGSNSGGGLDVGLVVLVLHVARRRRVKLGIRYSAFSLPLLS